MRNTNGIQVVAVTGGKGGVGKSNIAINLSLALLRMHKRVALLDADLGLANVDVLLGLTPDKTLEDVLAGDCELKDILLQGPKGLSIVPASSGSRSMVNLDLSQHAALINAFNSIDDLLDVLIIDTAAGIENHVMSFVHASNEVIVVVCDEPSSLTDAYALIKLSSRDYGRQRFRVVSNMTESANDGRALFEKLQRTTDQFLDVSIQYAGHIPFDEQLRKAVRKQVALLEHSPRSRAGQAFRALAEKVDRWPVPSQATGQLEFFFEKLLLGNAV